MVYCAKKPQQNIITLLVGRKHGSVVIKRPHPTEKIAKVMSVIDLLRNQNNRLSKYNFIKLLSFCSLLHFLLVSSGVLVFEAFLLHLSLIENIVFRAKHRASLAF